MIALPHKVVGVKGTKLVKECGFRVNKMSIYFIIIHLNQKLLTTKRARSLKRNLHNIKNLLMVFFPPPIKRQTRQYQQ